MLWQWVQFWLLNFYKISLPFHSVSQTLHHTLSPSHVHHSCIIEISSLSPALSSTGGAEFQLISIGTLASFACDCI
ncbi:hypothetical protein KC19_1G034000 [Ceratodon purpureus]|uniref:Uncharacterized protein n=1 Tax=Ceratodon purpureus TaxID=3225 RepID=A0A8T0J0X5_CERPU|nr:hypothetical protein KC19_1G034000 [Ceratodon purpureus]